MTTTTTTTIDTHPDHPVVGKTFRGWDGDLYLCDSHDTRWGYWMTRVGSARVHHQDETSDDRRNVSERAIGRTYHRFHVALEVEAPA